VQENFFSALENFLNFLRNGQSLRSGARGERLDAVRVADELRRG
jgi:hypothetical protein